MYKNSSLLLHEAPSERMGLRVCLSKKPFGLFRQEACMTAALPRPQARIKFNLFSPATCASGKTHLRSSAPQCPPKADIEAQSAAHPHRWQSCRLCQRFEPRPKGRGFVFSYFLFRLSIIAGISAKRIRARQQKKISWAVPLAPGTATRLK